jgi:hypothetical protein
MNIDAMMQRGHMMMDKGDDDGQENDEIGTMDKTTMMKGRLR